jgi:hypothetical protein
VAYRIQRRHSRMSGGFAGSAVATGRWLAVIGDWRGGLAAPAIAAALAGPALAAPAGAGAGISGWPVCLSTAARPGGSYQLANGGRYGLGGPPGTTGVQVVNTGSGPETLALSAVPLHSPSLLPGSLPVPASWVSFGPGRVRLDAGKYAWVTVTLHVPAGARRGAYAADIADAAVNLASPGTASLGAASTTLLLFTVGQGRPPASWPEAVTSPCWYTEPPAPAYYTPIKGSDGKTRMIRMGTWGPGAAVSAHPVASPQPPAQAQPAARKKPSKVASGWPGWLALAGLAAAAVAWRRKRSRS